ncbi:2-oxoglutarate dehydrogenase E1 component [Bradyrhizobium archetypum]|uniref:2-oxoglutarate dehydrogenase E1 component n=1 Tax=Bradyrhizobium archetypum TaxID=2721160 RepID=A0A7Y4M5B5_9BRAD|nr:2-oxoglutarate dehydrogenase E1 component [Bradyrhizobium archetypum]NOJ50822.1 2-oxoglutarate dehydrogenase E1 component [Bradyrhizobium archetypum]
MVCDKAFAYLNEQSRMNLPFSGDSSFFLNLYARYLKDPQSVPADWVIHFESLNDSRFQPVEQDEAAATAALVEAFRSCGHKEAQLDPLRLAPAVRAPEIARASGRLGSTRVKLFVAGCSMEVTKERADEILREVYCGHVALEAAHLDAPKDRAWIYEFFEKEVLTEPDERILTSAMEAVLLADEFERFIKTKWPTKKRFGIEGSESSAVILKEILREAAKAGQTEAVVGGMHRGRLATLATVFGKSLPVLISEITGRDITAGDELFTGDVPYHNGLVATVDTGCGCVEARVLPHPSHLIVVAPVATGAARARQELHARQRTPGGVLPLLMHTDAAFAGQGLVSELLQMDGLAGYSPGGTIHLVVNNQIGFTTLPGEGRSTPYPTDIGKAYGVPILHVNGDDPIAAAAAARVAYAWRSCTGRDVIIDLVCYRRNGHNELDEPRFTQPIARAAIEEHPSLRTLFSEHVRTRSREAFEAAEIRRAEFAQRLAEAYESYGKLRLNDVLTETIVFPETPNGSTSETDPETGVDSNTLCSLGRAITELPDDFEPDPKVRAFLRSRWASIEEGIGLNMATAEALAFASLLDEGASVRLSGQDCIRGTFTQRHLAIHDQRDGRTFVPLGTLAREGVRFDAVNSPLTEYGVLAFEFGMSLADSNRLIVWEAQFGDFLNGAQIAVDQYIATSEPKWKMRSSLVIALPHGLEGQGPDHSSARIERILQSCAGENITVAIPSTPANLFHLLRRQQRSARRTPLFLIAPKSLLRERACQSALSELASGTRFRTVLVTDTSDRCARIVFCAGKIFYPLNEMRLRECTPEVTLIRIEQLYPFPSKDVREALEKHSAAELVWCQEEPENQGAYYYVDRMIREIDIRRPLRYIGRPPMAAAAGGSIDRHEREQAEIVAAAIGRSR